MTGIATVKSIPVESILPEKPQQHDYPPCDEAYPLGLLQIFGFAYPLH